MKKVPYRDMWAGGAGIPKALNVMADHVLAYKPKPKSKPARKRARRSKKIQRESL